MSQSTHERSHEIDLPALNPRWPEPDSPPDTDGTEPAATPEHHAVNAGPDSLTLRPKPRRLRLAGVVLAAAVVGAAGTHWVDRPRTPAYTPSWMVSCQEAINATAKVHQLQDLQFEQGMQDAWALVGGVHIHPSAIDTLLNARLQHDADTATARCVSPASPQT